jgi:SAM-dependent methyltransferase
MSYYENKVDDLRRLFGTDEIKVARDSIRIDGAVYDVRDDVILTLPPERRPGGSEIASTDFAPEIQRTFGREWELFDRILPEHHDEFEAYFDLVDLAGLGDALVCDLGCGMGRWSYFLAPKCRRLVLVDFSDAIFVARRNLSEVADPIFLMADVTRLPLADDCCDLAFSLGVLHHLPVDALDVVRSLRRLSPQLLVYLYYALDNRPVYFRALLRFVTAIRRRSAGIDDARARAAVTSLVTYGAYLPLVGLGRVAARLGLERFVPLAETYRGKSPSRIRQDVYDRFFTSIEQRFTRRQIEALQRDFSGVEVSDVPPYWHFLCRR